MKKAWIFPLILSGILLTGCQTSQPPEIFQPVHDAANQAETAGSCLELLSPDALSQNVSDALRQEWDSWRSLSQEARALSSRTPGYCQHSFDSWTECEEFLGLSIPNPLEECSWLEKATYAAMPIGFQEAPRVEASWYGTEDGHVEWVYVQAGYRNNQIRVMIGASLYTDPADIKPPDRGWSIELARQDYLAKLDGSSPQITSDRTERYFSNTAYQAQNNVLYCFHIVGEPDAQPEVERTLERVLAAAVETTP